MPWGDIAERGPSDERRDAEEHTPHANQAHATPHPHHISAAAAHLTPF